MEYDFGDGWEVKLTLEAVIEDKELPGRELPHVLEGEGYGIIEDCGGPSGLVRIPDLSTLRSLLVPWASSRNSAQKGVDWHFTTNDARTKLKHLYPIIEF